METINFLLGLFALGVAVMALPTVFQMFGGAPKLCFKNNEVNTANGITLALVISNLPVKKWLYFLKVYRMPASITALCEILEEGSKRIICPMRRVHISTPIGTAYEVSVNHGDTFATILYLEQEHGQNFASTIHPNEEQILVPTGKYIARFIVREHTQKNHCYEQVFVIDNGRLYNSGNLKKLKALQS